MDYKTHLALGQLSLRHLHLPAEERGNADEGGHYPNRRDHDSGPCRRPGLEIVHCLGDAPVPVQRDEAQVHDRGGAEQDIHGRVDIAPPAAENPVAHQLVGQREGHYDEAEKEIRHRQRGYEPVLNILEGLLRGDGDYY